MKKIMILSLMLISLVFIFGCTQPTPTQKEYVCPDGSTVTDSSLCQSPKVTCADGTEVDDRSECCKESSESCQDKFGTYYDNVYCDGKKTWVADEYSCKSNRCIKETRREYCENDDRGEKICAKVISTGGAVCVPEWAIDQHPDQYAYS